MTDTSAERKSIDDDDDDDDKDDDEEASGTFSSMGEIVEKLVMPERSDDGCADCG